MIPTASLLPEPPRRRHDHDDLQQAVIEYLDVALPPDAICHHSPNEGMRTKRARGVMKRSGTRAGWPDIEIIWRGHFIGLELKTPGDTVSEAQREMHRRLSYCGAPMLVCRSVAAVEADLRALGVPLRGRVT